MVFTGIALMLIGFMFPEYVPILDGYTVNELEDMCKSFWGQLGRAFSCDVREACGYVKVLKGISVLSIIIGGILIIYGFASENIKVEG